MGMVKLFLRKAVLADGTSSLVLKVFKDGIPSIVKTDINLKHSDWDKKKQRVKTSHPNSTRLNNMLLKKLSEASDKAIELETNHAAISSKTIMKKIKPNSGGSFFKQAETYLVTLKEAGKFNEYTADKPRIKHFKDFLNGSDIVFPDVTVGLLERFKHYLATTLTVGKEKRPVQERTVINHLVVIRSVFSQAIKQGAVEKKYYPFGKEGIQIKFPESQKVGLSAEEVKAIEDVELANANHNHARNLWLISFYFGGMRVSDVLRLKWSDFKDNRLHYTMGKNSKPGSLKATERVSLILAQYESGKRSMDDFIFPELKKIENLHDEFLMERIISENASRVDKFLRKFVAPAAGITNKLTMHIARHTFGNIAGNNKVSLIMLQKIFRHSRITTTMGYMANFIHKDADEALDAVIGG
jgi:integrase/recombinase XerD